MARPVKAALVRLDTANSNGNNTLVFQYNPEKLERTLDSRQGEPPREVIRCTAVFDATDVLAGDPLAGSIFPAIAAIELLMHEAPPEPAGFWDRLFGRQPRSAGPPIAAFVWGVGRVVPVRITRLHISETLHDGELRPLRASVRIQMEVVDQGVSTDLPASNLWLAHVVKMQAAARKIYTGEAPGAFD